MNKEQIKQIYTNYTSPFYVFDYEELKNRVKKIRSILPQNSKLCYAIKANPFIINALKDSDILFEVCSPGELSICEAENVLPQKIVFSGVCKTLEDIKRAYDINVNTITLESVLHCDYLTEAIREAKNLHNINVIIRLTSGNQFGMSKEDVNLCIEKLKKISCVHIRGIHYFTGTQKKLSKIQKEVSFITEYCLALKSQKQVDFSDIEYGPGLSFDYFSQEDYSENFDELNQFSNYIKDIPFNFVVELGRYIASSCGYYVTKILDIKSDPESNQNYIITDGGINHINYYGQMMGMKNPSIEHVRINDTIQKKAKDFVICGSLCTTADIILRKLSLAEPNLGDFLIFKNIGAYSVTEGIYLFLSHPLPQIFIYENGMFTLLRNTIETYKINTRS